MGRRGFTYTEILVALFLLGVVSLLVARVLMASLHTSAKESARMEMEQTALFALQKVVRDLQLTSVGGVSYLPKGEGQTSGVAINPFDDVSAEGNLAWQNRAIAFTWEPTTGLLNRAVLDGLPSPSLTAPTRLSTGELGAALASARGVTLSRGVVDFEVLNREPVTMTSRALMVRLELERTIPRSGLRRFRMERQVTLRN